MPLRGQPFLSGLLTERSVLLNDQSDLGKCLKMAQNLMVTVILLSKTVKYLSFLVYIKQILFIEENFLYYNVKLESALLTQESEFHLGSLKSMKLSHLNNGGNFANNLITIIMFINLVSAENDVVSTHQLEC